MQITMMGRTYSPLISAPLHSHDQWELVMHQSGTGVTQIGDNSIPFSPGSITICPPNIKHSKTADNGCFEDIWVTFSGFPLIEKMHSIIFYDDADRKIETLLMMAFTTFYQKNPGWSEICSSLLTTISQILYHQSIKNQIVDKVQIVQNEIIRNFTNPEFQLETLMDQLPYNKDYLRRCFKKALGINPIEYLINLRLEYANTILTNNPNYSIKDIAWMSGFYDPSYFSRLYKKQYQISPSVQCRDINNKDHLAT